MSYKECFVLPKQVKVTGRTSSVTNSFVNGIIPTSEPSEDEIKKALEVLKMEPDKMECVYCGGSCDTWDHLNPLVRNKRPTGYLTEIHNLVPCCNACNTSKGNKPWHEWMFSSAKLSPKTKGVKNLEERASRIAEYEREFIPARLDIERVIGKEEWDGYWKALDQLHEHMAECQEKQDRIAKAIKQGYEAMYGTARTSLYMEETHSQPVVSQGNNARSGEKKKETRKATAIPKKGERLVSSYVKGELTRFLLSDRFNDDLLSKLKDKAYCKKTLGINLPLLKEITSPASASAESKDEYGNGRYYVKPLAIGKKYYLLCSQWYAKQKESLITWLETFDPEFEYDEK